jgi:hypothetical protein
MNQIGPSPKLLAAALAASGALTLALAAQPAAAAAPGVSVERGAKGALVVTIENRTDGVILTSVRAKGWFAEVQGLPARGVRTVHLQRARRVRGVPRVVVTDLLSGDRTAVRVRPVVQ